MKRMCTSLASEWEWECEVVLCESEMSEEEDIAAVMGFSGFGKTCKGRSHLTCHKNTIEQLHLTPLAVKHPQYPLS